MQTDSTPIPTDNLLKTDNLLNSAPPIVGRPSGETLATPNKTRDGGPAASPAISRARECRNELKQLAVVLRQTDEQPLTARKLAAGLDRNLRSLEFEIGRLETEAAGLCNQLTRERQKSAPVVPVAIEATSAPVESSDVFEPEHAPDAAPSRTSFRSRVLRPALWAIPVVCVAAAALWFVPMLRRPDTSRIVPGDASREVLVVMGTAGVRGTARPRTLSPEFASRSPQFASGVVGTDGFSRGAELLDAALAEFQGETPEDILTRVHNENAANGIYVCSFEWNNGMPSLLFDNGKDHLNLDVVMRRCAEAVLKY